MTCFCLILKMNENNSIEAIEETKFRLSKIIGIENYSYQEIDQRKSGSKKLNNFYSF